MPFRLFEVGDDVCGAQVLALLFNGTNQRETLYRVRWAGCGHETEISHRALAKRMADKPVVNTCRHCRRAATLDALGPARPRRRMAGARDARGQWWPCITAHSPLGMRHTTPISRRSAK